MGGNAVTGRILFPAGVLLCVGLLAACRTTAPAATCGEAFSFVVVHMNDVYEIAPLDGGRVGGMARVAALVRHVEAYNPNTLVVLSGDFLSPSLISSLREDGAPIAGVQMLEAMEAVGVDYVAFGNHEFDLPEDVLLRRLEASRFTYLAANVRHRRADGTTAPFRQGAQRTPVPDHAVHTFHPSGCEPVRVGLIGLTLPFNRRGYVAYEDVYERGLAAYEAARAGSDVVLAVTHLTIGMDSTLARRIPGLPLILGGHEHEDTLAVVGDTRIAKADANARTVYLHWITYHRATGAVDVWSQLIPVTDDLPEDPAAAAVVRGWEVKARSILRAEGYDADAVVARLKTPLDGREAVLRRRPTNLGRLVACAFAAADPTAQLALLNSGSIRLDDVLSGQITQRDVLRTLPFGGGLVHGSIRGDTLRQILDVGWHTNVGSGGYLQTTPGLTRHAGAYLLDGSPLEDTRRYEVVLPAFLASGREANLGFMKASARYRPLELTGVDGTPKNDVRDVLIRFLQAGGTCPSGG